MRIKGGLEPWPVPSQSHWFVPDYAWPEPVGRSAFTDLDLQAFLHHDRLLVARIGEE